MIALLTISTSSATMAKSNNRFDGLTCLLVDDEPELVDILSEYLTDLGFTVTSETKSENAFTKMSQVSYDLAITDLRMPKLNGLELIKMVKLLSDSKPKHIFLVTGDVKYEDENLPQSLRDLSIEGIFGKPYDYPTIEKKLYAAFFPSKKSLPSRAG